MKMPAKTNENESDTNSATKYFSLATLVFQNSALALFMRYSRMKNSEASYASTTAVIMSEIMKLCMSCTLVWKDTGSMRKCLEEIQYYTIDDPMEYSKMFVPALLYTFQNWLAYVAVTHLNASTYQLLYQMKIATTAFFSVVMLKKVLTKQQWTSLLLLILGVALVQLSIDDGAKNSNQQTGSQTVGLIAVSLACLSSGFAGVYFEKVLKGTNATVWIRNIQLSSIGLVIAIVNAYINDVRSIVGKGFFFGYNWTVWMAVLLNAGGGLLVAVVVKYAGNILKGFATSISIVVSVLVSYFILSDLKISVNLVTGAFMVMSATVLYAVKFENCDPIRKSFSRENPDVQSATPENTSLIPSDEKSCDKFLQIGKAI